MKIKIAEAPEQVIDFLVAKCEGVAVVAWQCEDRSAYYVVMADAFTDKDPTTFYESDDTYYPSTNWAQGGPIIEREKLCVGYRHQLDPVYVPLLDPATVCWARTTAGGYLNCGPTPLIAAMRCFVASKLGDEVDVPEELCASAT